MYLVLEGNTLYILMERLDKLKVMTFDSIDEIKKYINQQDYKVLREVRDKGKVMFVVTDGYLEFEIIALEVEISGC